MFHDFCDKIATKLRNHSVRHRLLMLTALGFLFFGVTDIFVYFYNLITVTAAYGAAYFWQPLLTNIDKVAWAIIYFYIAYQCAERGGQER